MKFWCALIAMVAAVPAWAADKIHIAPAPEWVRPVAPGEMKSAGGSTTYLLADQQFRLEPGKIGSFTETIWRIETPEGLESGNISLPWQPETETLAVHKLMIRRGDAVIDILKSGQQFTILRREADLESATLDGTLTANIQPEDLQVGDVIELATTVTSSDPIYRNHVERATDAIYGVEIGRAHISAEWPSALPVRLRQTEGLSPLTPRRHGDMSRVELTLDKLKPPVLTSRAPARFRRPRLIEISDFQDWGELAALFVPMYEKAAAIPAGNPLQAEIAQIRAASTDPKARAEAALALVQGRVRYVALLMGAGNFVPADATQTWSRRFGDCKAKSALLVAILRALDIEADPVIVDTSGNDGLDQRLPMITLFNHVIVRATIGGRAYWLDGTRTGDKRLDQLGTPAYDWGLPLTRRAALVRMLPERLALPEADTILRIDARAGISLPAPAHAEIVMRGDDAYAMQLLVSDMTADARDDWLRGYWTKRYPFIQVEKASQSYDADRREHRLTMDGIATMDWRGGVYWLTNSEIGDSGINFERSAKEDGSAPFRVGFPYFQRATETLLLPPGVVLRGETDIDQVAGGIHFLRKASREGDAFVVVSSMESITREFAAGEAAAAQTTIRALATKDIALRVTDAYVRTKQEASSRLAQIPTSAEQWVERGFMLLDREQNDDAFTAFEKALSTEPDDVSALIGRGTAQAMRGNLEAAAKDLAAAEAIDPASLLLPRAQGMLAHFQDRLEDAARYYTKALQLHPDDHLALGWRAQIFADLRDYPAALIDTERAIQAIPYWVNLYDLRARILQRLGKPDQALAEAAAVTAANPKNIYAHRTAADIYHRLGKADDAVRAMNRAIEIKPAPASFLMRYHMRHWTDVAGREEDVGEALRLDPGYIPALQEKAIMQHRNNDLAGAVATLSAALKLAPEESDLLSQRGQAYYQAGRQREADKDFAAARRVAKTAIDFNQLCWHRVLAGVDVLSALPDCDASIGLDPDDYAPLDTKGLALLKLGRFDEAILFYDRALKKEPALADSLFGRAVARANMGEQAKAGEDRAAAIALNRDIAEAFRFYGVAMPGRDMARPTDGERDGQAGPPETAERHVAGGER